MWQEKFGTILIVVALTGLIWFFADRANKDSKTIKVLVKVQPAGNIVVLKQDPVPLQFDVTVSAPRGVINEIEKETQAQGGPLRATLPLYENIGRGEQQFRADTELTRLDVIQQRGLTITAVKPETFTLDIDRLVQRQSIRIKPQFPRLEVVPEELNPGTCSIFLPESLAAQLAGDEIPVDVSGFVDPTQPGTGAPISKTVTLRWPTAAPGAELVRFEPPSFTVKFRLKDTTKSQSFESVQVRYDLMPDIADKYQIVRPDLSEWRPTITVSGPTQQVEALKKSEIQLLVPIGAEDAARVGITNRRPVWVDLPPGIQLEGALPQVRFILQDRSTMATTGN